MKICIVTTQYGNVWSGLGTYATNLINALADAGHDVSVLCPDIQQDKVHPRIRLIDSSPIKIAPDLRNWVMLSYFFSRLLSAHLRYESFDIIHFADARESLFCRVDDTPVIGTMHDYYFIEAPLNPGHYRRFYTDWVTRWAFYNVSRVIEKFALKRIPHVIANTGYVKNALVSNYSLNPANVHIVYYGVADDFPGPSGPDQPPLEGRPSILFVGANFQRKGLPVLIRAVAEAKKQFPDIVVHVVGRDAKQPAMEALAMKYGVKNSIRFLGWVDNVDVRRLYRRAQMFVLPSMVEGFGIVFLEAMAAGVPVVGGKCGGTPELIVDDENGFVVNPDDWKKLSQRIALLAGDNKTRDRLIRTGAESGKRFSIERMLEETLACYAKAR